MMRVNKFGQPVGQDMPGWAPRPLPQKIILEGVYCDLEPISAALHGNALYDAHNVEDDEPLWTYLFNEKPESKEAFLAFVDTLAASGDPLHFAVVDKTSKQALGTLSLMRIDSNNGVIEIGHVNYSRALQKTRLASEAVYLLLKYVYAGLGFRRCEWKCDNYNEPSKKAALRFGFSYEGLFRQAVIIKNRTRDTAWFASIDKEWPMLKAGFERWLDPSNFDEHGGQKNRLFFEKS